MSLLVHLRDQLYHLFSKHFASNKVFFQQSTIKLLVTAGANVDLQTGSYRGNVSALMLAAAQGHLDVVKGLVELKASPDKKGGTNSVLDKCGEGVKVCANGIKASSVNNITLKSVQCHAKLTIKL